MKIIFPKVYFRTFVMKIQYYLLLGINLLKMKKISTI